MQQTETKSNENIQPIKKSIELTEVEVSSIKAYARNFDTKELAAKELGIDRGTLARILGMGTCSSDTFNLFVAKNIIEKRDYATA